MEFKDYYETLGVARNAATDDIRKSYRRMARKYHPDVSREPDAEARFKEVQEAYEVLKDPEKRAAYDRFGKDWKAGQEFRPPPDWDPGFDFAGGGFTEADGFSDFFETLFGGARGRGAAGGGGGRGEFRARGGHQQARIAIGLEDAYRGTTRALALDVPEVDTHGHLVTRRRTLSVRIPPGVTEGQHIRLGGQGMPGFGGGQAGDLFLEVVFEPHPLFRAEGRDIHVELPVAPWEAALGATVKTPTLGGAVELKIPPGSQSAKRLRLKGRGLPGPTPGDQYVTLRVVVPEAKTAEARELYRRMAETLDFDPRRGMVT